jgi:hypothetical protein
MLSGFRMVDEPGGGIWVVLAVVCVGMLVHCAYLVVRWMSGG